MVTVTVKISAMKCDYTISVPDVSRDSTLELFRKRVYQEAETVAPWIKGTHCVLRLGADIIASDAQLQAALKADRVVFALT